MKCQVRGCNHQAFDTAIGRCTLHAGLTLHTSSKTRLQTLRKNIKKGLPPLSRQFIFEDQPPARRQYADPRATLNEGQMDFYHACQDHPGQWARLPDDLIDEGFHKLSDADKRRLVANQVSHINTGAAWRASGGRFRAVQRGITVWATFEPEAAKGQLHAVAS